MTDRPPPRFRRRLTAAFVLVAAISAGLVATVSVLLARETRLRSLRSAIVEEARFAAAVSPPNLDDHTFEAFRIVYERRSDANIVAVTGRSVFASSPDLDLADVPPSLLVGAGDDPQLVESTVSGRSMIVAGIEGRDGAHYFTFFALDQLKRGNDELARTALVSWLAVVVLAGAAGRVIARRTLRPVAVVAEASEAIAAGDLSARLPGGGHDEFGTLADSFNHMADEVQTTMADLADAAERERRMTADLAHELRTPLTAMSAGAQLLVDQLEELPPDAAIASSILAEDIARFQQLTLTLLELAALDAESEPARLEVLDVDDAIREATAASGIPPSVSLSTNVPAGFRVTTDPVRLGRVLVNVLTNALVHGDGAPIEISASRFVDCVLIRVVDHGPGIAPADLGRVFDRFYTSDRARSSRGSGLGLSIARGVRDQRRWHARSDERAGTLDANAAQPSGGGWS